MIQTGVLVDDTAKRTLLRKIPHALYACGVRGEDELNMFTASWVTQGSFTPPLVVMGVKADTLSHRMILASKVFALSFLESGQQELAQRFFQPTRRVGNKLNDVDFELGVTGCPVLVDCLGHVECEVVETVAVGDHTVVVGRVLEAVLRREGAALELKETKWQYGG